MGWLNKIFKGSSHKISEGNYHGRYQGDTVQNEPSCSGDVWAETENEDIDRAIALSLSEEEQKGKKVIDNEFQLEEDEQLARAIQESLNIESPPQHGNGNGNGNGNIYQPIPFPYSTGFRICAGCNTEIGHGRFLSCMGAVWHPECFRCHGCGYPISDYEYSMNGNYPYHKSCYKEHYHPKCDVCKHFIPTNPAGLIEYRAHPFWVQKYCPSHEHDRTPRCCSCERMEPRDTRYVALNDGRKLCLECLDSAIMDTNECQPLYLDIQEFYEGLNMKVQQQVPLLLVERQALNEAMEGEKSVRANVIKNFIPAMNHGSNECQPLISCSTKLYEDLDMTMKQQVSLLWFERQALNEAMERRTELKGVHLYVLWSTTIEGHHHMPETRGLCLSEEQTVSTILRRPKIGTGNRVMNMITEPCKLTRRCDVTAVLILYGLPRLLTGSILAHEMMHAWLRLNGYRTLAQDVEEGICQVLAYMWLDAELTSGSGSNVPSTSSASTSSKKGAGSQCERKLGQFFKHQIESDTSLVYGAGFRAGHQAVLKYGLPATLKHIHLTGNFPY